MLLCFVHVQSQGQTDDDGGSCVHPEVGPECYYKSNNAGGGWVDCDDNCACVLLCDDSGKKVFWMVYLKLYNVSIQETRTFADIATVRIGLVSGFFFVFLVVVFVFVDQLYCFAFYFPTMEKEQTILGLQNRRQTMNKNWL
jgi:hypothetical protein